MSNGQENNPNPPAGDENADEKKGYKSYLNYLKDNKSSKISAWIGKASDIYSEISKYAQTDAEVPSGSIIGPDAVIAQGALTKAVEIARMEWMKAKLESEDPVELSEKYNTRMSRMNDEYHLKKLMFNDVSIVGFMKDKDSKADRLLVAKEDSANQVFAVDPKTGVVLEVFEVATKNCLLALRRAD
jgi:hypothetical protein